MTNTFISQADEVSESIVNETVTFNVTEVIQSSTIETSSDPNAVIPEVDPEIQTVETVDSEVQIIETSEVPEVHTFETSPPKGEKGDPGATSGMIVEYPVAYPMSGHRIVVLNGNKEAIYASSDNPLHATKVLGMTTGAAIFGNIGIQTGGVLIEPSWSWILDTPIWLGLNGLMTQTVPASGFSLIVGFPISPTEMFVDIREPFFLI